MRTRKCLILSPLFLIFNNDLSEITNVKESFKNQNILDLFRFDKIKSITEYKFNGYNINFVYLPKNIEKIEYCAFYKNQIQILDLSNCIKLKHIIFNAFSNNPLNEIKILDNIKIEYDKKNINNLWNKFAIYYNDNNKKAGDYKLENNEWQWYPL